MKRAFLFLCLGILLGAGAIYLARDDAAPRAAADPNVDSPSSDLPVASDSAGPRAIDLLDLATGSVGAIERAQIYALAARADRATLESFATQIAALPDIEGRRVALDALLARYIELDAKAAVALARKLEVPPGQVIPLLESWARRDTTGALRTLPDLDSATAAALGIGLLSAFGNDAAGIERVLSAAPQIDADRFRVDAAIAKAAFDARGAFDDALALPSTRSAAGLTRIVVTWARQDAREVLTEIDGMQDEVQRELLRLSVIRDWAARDAEAALAYVIELDPEGQQQILTLGAFEAFSQLEPRRALALADRLPGQTSATLRRVALVSLARDDPLDAWRHAETLPPGVEREQLVGAIATLYGRKDPEAALAWARALEPPAPNVLANVLAGLARVDPVRAIDLLFAETPANEQQRTLQTLVISGALRAEQTAAVADRLVATPGRGPALQTLANLWAQREPEEALQWLLANRERAPTGAIAQAGRRLGQTDLTAAVAHLERVPGELRATWLRSMAEGHAQNDPRGAVSWIAQYRGEAGYEAAVVGVAFRAAEADAPRAARLLDSIDLSQASSTVGNAAAAVAGSWAAIDPRAAADWAMGLRHEEARASAIGRTISQWGARDAGAARAWVLASSPSTARDAALVALMSRATQGTMPDATVLGAFSSTEAQQRGIADVVRNIGTRNAPAARELADRYLTDPALRQATERFIGR